MKGKKVECFNPVWLGQIIGIILFIVFIIFVPFVVFYGGAYLFQLIGVLLFSLHSLLSNNSGLSEIFFAWGVGFFIILVIWIISPKELL